MSVPITVIEIDTCEYPECNSAGEVVEFPCGYYPNDWYVTCDFHTPNHSWCDICYPKET